MIAAEERTYRNLIEGGPRVSFRVVVKETDLQIYAHQDLKEEAREQILTCRGQIEGYIRNYPQFAETLKPWPSGGAAPSVVREMIRAGEKAGVGPMAAVAGAVAESVGKGLLPLSDEVIVENGGDLFIRTQTPLVVGIYAGKSPLSLKVGIRLHSQEAPISVCTSSGTIGHSLSFGKADAICVVSPSCPLADAAATAIGNLLNQPSDIQTALDVGKGIDGVQGLLAIVGDQMGIWGDIELVPVRGKKG
jgi:ApbE superfamily uncharacterized protein (UPF0280 family)